MVGIPMDRKIELAKKRRNYLKEYEGQINSDGLTKAQARALPYMLMPGSITKRCKAACLDDDKYYEWMHTSEAWRKAIDKYSQQVFESVINDLCVATHKALTTVEEILDESNDDSDRLRASDMIFSHAHKLTERKQVIEGIREIRSMIQQRDNTVQVSNQQ